MNQHLKIIYILFLLYSFYNCKSYITQSDEYKGLENEVAASKTRLQTCIDNCQAERSRLNQKIETLTRELSQEKRSQEKMSTELATLRNSKELYRGNEKLEDTTIDLEKERIAREVDRKNYEDRLAKLEVDNELLRKDADIRTKELLEENSKLKQKCKRIIYKLRNRYKNLSEQNHSQQEQTEALNEQFLELEKELKLELNSGYVRLIKNPSNLLINLNEIIAFESGTAQLNGRVQPILDKVIGILLKYPGTYVDIKGHTDNSAPVSTKYSDNWTLSTDRAIAVLRYFLQNNLLNPKKFSAAGYAHYQPIYPNDNTENKALNQRVEIVIHYDEE
ncbi:MAG: OmpA family protein [Leptospiraceae bacterium]|nr:OmpA family protein [Leptospiraceae bacterium]MCP5496329.1 OmpA family protein [Leptospiraceae bacterium]